MIGLTPPEYLDRPFIGGVYETGISGGVMAKGEDVRWFFSMEDKSGDDYGPGIYKYPTDASFAPYKDILDLRKYMVGESADEVVFKLVFGKLTNPWNAPLGFSMPIINIYLATDPKLPNSTKTLFNGANVEFDKAFPWNYFLKIAGFPDYGQHLFTPDGKKWNVKVFADASESAVIIRVPKSIIGEPKGKKWAHYVIVGSQDGYGPDNFRKVTPEPSQWTLGGNDLGDIAPRVIDMLDPAYTGEDQRDMLSSVDPEVNQLARIKPVVVEGR
jgi:carbohydrate-binding DOMON domain-containing protein